MPKRIATGMSWSERKRIGFHALKSTEEERLVKGEGESMGEEEREEGEGDAEEGDGVSVLEVGGVEREG